MTHVRTVDSFPCFPKSSGWKSDFRKETDLQQFHIWKLEPIKMWNIVYAVPHKVKHLVTLTRLLPNNCHWWHQKLLSLFHRQCFICPLDGGMFIESLGLELPSGFCVKIKWLMRLFHRHNYFIFFTENKSVADDIQDNHLTVQVMLLYWH